MRWPRMGCAPDQVTWVRVSSDDWIQPGARGLDNNRQQGSITRAREAVVDFSQPAYPAALAVLVREPTVEAGGDPGLESLESLVWGADGNATAVPTLHELIDPARDPLRHDGNVDVSAAIQAGPARHRRGHAGGGRDPRPVPRRSHGDPRIASAC